MLLDSVLLQDGAAVFVVAVWKYFQGSLQGLRV